MEPDGPYDTRQVEDLRSDLLGTAGTTTHAVGISGGGVRPASITSVSTRVLALRASGWALGLLGASELFPRRKQVLVIWGRGAGGLITAQRDLRGSQERGQELTEQVREEEHDALAKQNLLGSCVKH